MLDQTHCEMWMDVILCIHVVMVDQDCPKSRKNLSSVMSSSKYKTGHSITDKERQNQYSSRSNAMIFMCLLKLVTTHDVRTSKGFQHKSQKIHRRLYSQTHQEQDPMYALYSHLKCIGEPNNCSGVWTCLDCRQFPRLLNALVTNVKDISSEFCLLNLTVSDITNNSSSGKDIVAAVKNEVCALKPQVADLQNEKACLKSRLQTPREDTKSAGTAMSSLLIGSSVIQNIQSVSP